MKCKMPRIQNIEQFQINLGKNKPDNQVKDVVVILVRTLLGTSGGLSLDSRYKGVCGTLESLCGSYLPFSRSPVQHGSGK